ISEKPDLEPEALLGRPMTVTLALRDDTQRHFHGYVTQFGLGTRRGRYHGYQATLRPWLWFLTRTSDCRIFQESTVPDIVRKVFEDHAIADFEFKLFRPYRKWTYCVQYRESDYDFVARLLEHEGIYWYFTHTDSAHTLVLVDSQGAHDAVPGCESLPYFESITEAPPDTDFISRWHFAREVATGIVATTSYDFERPSTSLQAEKRKQRGYELSDYEQFDYQGDYSQADDGRHWVDNRVDELQTRFELLRGSSNAQGLGCGHLVKMVRHPREDQNAEYLVTAASVHARQATGESSDTGDPGDAHHYSCDFSAIPSTQQFRPPRRTPKPFVRGPQTAVVVGPGGDEIHTDKYGRVKVQFHWDRYGKKNEKSGCWVRVSHPWAGKNFGAVHIPRIGQEVVVDFLEGDPDQPLITGRVYNAEQMPPWELPANATQSGILTRSSKGGGYGNANAIRFEDKMGSEQLWIHAEKNQDIEVENDETHSVGHDRTKTVGHDETVHVAHDRTETVDHDEKITIGVDRTESVGNNEKIAIGVDRTETVGSNESITVGSDRSVSVHANETKKVTLQRTHTVGVNETISIGAAQEITIGALQSVKIGATQSIDVKVSQSTTVGTSQTNDIGSDQTNKIGAKQATTVGADRSLGVSGAETHSVGKARTTSVADDDSLKVGKNLVIDAGDSITLKTGSASISMKKDGTITIKGKDITIDGSGKINIKASGDIVMKGSKILQN
ncbi:MAG TPA: type VI secretion system tip protein TssI/VgrG, partial [Variovorax sp.]|nr:type VI secretion system tip protein TssI/VgrG [Variovorax sp.]